MGEYEWISTIAAAVALIGAGYTIFYSRSQLRYAAITQPAQLTLQVDQIFLQHPLLRPYFYDSTPVPAVEAAPEMHHRIYAAAEFYLDVLEYILSGVKNYNKRDRESYREWIHDVFAGSPVMQELYLDNERWYPDLKRLRASRVCSTDSGHEFFTVMAASWSLSAN
jgi:hypothetical protein